MRVLLLTIMMIVASSASAGLYKWVDDEGNVHYSQKKPRGQQFERLKAPAPAPEDSKPLYQSSETNKKVGGEDTAAKETAKNNKIREENCTKAKKNLNSYQVYRRIRDKDGNVTIIDDNERAKQIKSAQDAISQYCE